MKILKRLKLVVDSCFQIALKAQYRRFNLWAGHFFTNVKYSLQIVTTEVHEAKASI